MYSIQTLLTYIYVVCLLNSLGKHIVLPDISLDKPYYSIPFAVIFITIIMTLLGFLGLLRPRLLLIIIVLSTLLLLKKIISDHKGYLSFGYLRSIKNKIGIPLLLIGIYIIIVELNALTPAISRDALNYHLYLPKLYLKEQGIITLTENIYSYFPAYWEVFSAFLLSISNDIVPKLMHSLYLILSVFLIIDSVKMLNRDSDIKDRIIAAIIFISAPTITKISSWAYIDISLSFYILLSIHLLIKYRGYKRPLYLYLSAVSVGFAAGMKYLGLIWVVLLGLFIIEIEADIYRSFKTYLKFIVIALILASPFYIRNYIETANPFFPFLSDIFGYKGIEPGRFNLMMSYFQSYGEGTGFKDLILLPYRLLFKSEFAIAERFDGKIGILYITAIFAAIRSRKMLPYKSLLYLPLIYTLIWFLMSQQIRFLIPSLMILSIITGLYLSFLKPSNLRRYIFIFMGSLYLYYPIKDFFELKPYNFILNRESGPEFIGRHIKAYPIIDYINNATPQEAKVMLLVVGPIAYLLERDVYQESIFEDYSFQESLKKGESDVRSFFKDTSADFILIDECFMQRYIKPSMDKEELGILKELYLKRFVLEYSWRNFFLYRVNFENDT